MSGLLELKRKRGFVSRKQTGFLFSSGWRTEWWEVDSNKLNGYLSPDSTQGDPVLEVKPKRAWKVTKLNKLEFLVHWKEGGSLHFKSTEGEEDRDVWVACISHFIVSAKEDDEAESTATTLVEPTTTRASTSKTPEKKKPDTFDVSMLGEVTPQVIPKSGSFGSLLGLIRPARLDVSEDALAAAPSAASTPPRAGASSTPGGNSSPHGNASAGRFMPKNNGSGLLQQQQMLPRMGSSRDMLDKNEVFMGKASNFAQKIAQNMDRSNARKEAAASPRQTEVPVTAAAASAVGERQSLDKNHNQQNALVLAKQMDDKVAPELFIKSAEQNALLVSTVSAELWSLLPQSVMRTAPPQTLVDLMFRVHIAANTTMVVQGEQHVDKLYVIETGRVGVYSFDFVDKPRGELEYVKKRGDCFFVHSLLYHQPGPFTITTHVDCTMWALSLKQFNDFMTLQTKKLVVRKLKLLESVPLIADSLSFETLVQLADCLELQEFARGEVIVREGEVAKKLYVVDEGELSVGAHTENGGPVLTKGNVFGEWALLADIKSRFPIEVKSDVALVLVMDIEEMEELIGPLRKFVARKRHGLPTPAQEHELAKLIPVQDDDQMFKFAFGSGEEETRLVRLATLSSLHRFTKQLEHNLSGGGARKRTLSNAGGVGTIPESAAVEDTAVAAAASDVLSATATPTTTKAKIFGRKSLHPDASFSRMVAQIDEEEVLATATTTAQEEELLEDIGELNMDLDFELQPPRLPDVHVDQQLTLLAQLGKGQFGTVHLAETNSNKDQRFAVKVMTAASLVENGWERMIECERNSMLELAGHPFLVSLVNYGSRAQRQVYLVMDLCEWGSLGDLLLTQRDGRLWHEAQAAFYLANVVLALEYMHSKDIIYRDLKTENIMVSSTGYCKLADFGLAKKTKQTYTFCGTPDFMAPEILLRRGHGSAVDWWACGVLLYELLAGETPFAGYETSDIYERVLAHVDPKQLHYPAHAASTLSAECKHVIQNLLHPKKNKRLGAKFPGVLGIKQHAFFALKGVEVDWAAVEAQTAVAPLAPVKQTQQQNTDSSYNADTRRRWDEERVDKTGWADRFAKA